jgi:hypothetical protein
MATSPTPYLITFSASPFVAQESDGRILLDQIFHVLLISEEDRITSDFEIASKSVSATMACPWSQEYRL